MFHLLSPQPQLTQTITQYLLISPTFPTFFSSQIIAILAAILFPVFARARESARATSCASNVRQIGLALLMYAQDYDERFAPYETRHGSTNRRASVWYDTIFPYTMNEDIYVCPSGDYTWSGHGSSIGGTRSAWPSGTGVFRETVRASYSVIRQGSSSDDDRVNPVPFPDSGRRMAQFTRPSETILVFETRTGYLGHKSSVGFYEDNTPRPMEDNGRVRSMMYRHSLQMNVVYADGHVRSIPQLTDINALMPF